MSEENLGGTGVRSNRSSNFGRGAVAVALLCGAMSPYLASGQTSNANDYDPFATSVTRRATGNGGDNQSTGGYTDNAGAAASQVSTNNGDDARYRPDRIENGAEDTVGGRRASDLTRDSSRDDNRRGEQDRFTLPQRAAQPSEFERYVSEVADKQLRRFGANLLVPDARDFTAPPTTTVPADYRLNPGDELVVGLTGAVQVSDLRLVIDPEGRVFIPQVGAVNVAGVRYGDVQSVIARQVARQYRDFRVAVTIGRLHGLTVYVTGFAATPGSYTVSSLSTLINAVLIAGGPSSGGSFRSIQLRRNGRLVSNFDLYDLLLKGDKSKDAQLQNEDVIYIAPAGAQAAVIGSVNSEAIFEARPTETLNDILLYAGGINTVADDTRALLLDPVKGAASGWRELKPGEAKSLQVQRGQVVRVLSSLGIARPLQEQPVLVTVSGEVARPGRYYLPAGVGMEEAVRQAGGLTTQAYVYGTVFTRESVRREQRLSYQRALQDTQYLLTVQPLTSALNDQNQIARVQTLRSAVEQLKQHTPDGRLVLNVGPSTTNLPNDLVLENNDTLYVPPRPITVGVFGSVPSPASFRYTASATIGDYVKRAGGVQKIGDRGQIFVVRANGILLAPGHGLFAPGVLSQRALPGDLIYVPIEASRGEFWLKLRDLTQVLFTGALSAAAVAAIN